MANNKQKLELTWVGKDEPSKLEPRILIEDPDKSYGDKNLENLLIYGDNLLALKALEQDFAGKVKCIYIDPPFNTDAAGVPYEDNIEHSIWLSLMRNRFIILRNLLADTGVLFVHLDDEESAYCKVLLDEIFGRANYFNEIIVATNKPFGFKSTADGIFKQANHIFMYAKEKSLAKQTLNGNALIVEREYDQQYKYVFEDKTLPEEKWTWRNINEVVSKELGFASHRDALKSFSKQEIDAQISIFALNNADRVFRTASVTGGAFLKRKETIALSKAHKTKIIRHPNDDMDYIFIGGERVIFYSDRLKIIDGLPLPAEIITDIWTDIPIEGLSNEGGVDFPKGKKPEKLVQRVIELASRPGDIVLDSFAGSGTTAAVAHKLGRRWITIELGDQCHTHCIPRLQNVVNGTDQSGISKSINWSGGGGFRYYYLAPSLLKKDKYANWVIDERYNPTMLAVAMTKQEGFKYRPDETFYWKQGQSTEKDFIFTTTSFITVEHLTKIKEEMKPDESLLICCKSFQEACANRYPNITLKKIPNMLLGRCDFGKDDYSLNIVNMPIDDDSEDDPVEDAVVVNPVKQKKTKKKAKKSDHNNQTDFFTDAK